MAKPVLEAYELLIFAHQTSKQLSVLAPSIAGRIDLERERAWLQAAVDLLATEVREIPALVERVRWLPELRSIRQERTGELIDAWVDSLEKLLAGITFHLGSRHPLIEAVFTHQRFPQLRRAAFETAQDYWAEIERRLRSSYVERMLASEPFAFARPVVAQARATWAAAAKNEGEVTLPAEELAAISAELQAMAERLELALKQARLLAEAATLRFPPEVLEETGLTVKPKKRPGKGVDLPAPKIEVTETWEPTPREPEPEAANARQAIEAEIPGSRLGGIEDAELTLDIPEPQPESLESELPSTEPQVVSADSVPMGSAQEDSTPVVEVAEVAEAPAPEAKPATKKGRRPATRELLQAKQPETEEKPTKKKKAKAKPEPKKPAKKAKQPEPVLVQAPAKKAKAKPTKQAEPAEPELVEVPQAPAKKTQTKPAKKTKAKAEPAPVEAPEKPETKAKRGKTAKHEPEPVQVPEAPAPKAKRAKTKPAEPAPVEVHVAPAPKLKRAKVAKDAEPAPTAEAEAPAPRAKRTKVAKPAEPARVELTAPAPKAKRARIAINAEPAPLEAPEATAPKSKRERRAKA